MAGKAASDGGPINITISNLNIKGGLINVTFESMKAIYSNHEIDLLGLVDT